MSEIPRDDSNNYYSSLQSIDYNSALDDIAAEISATYGIEQSTTTIGTEWARDWWYGVLALPPEEVSRDTIISLRDYVLDGLEVPRDATENRPTFRVRYAAQEAFLQMAGERDTEFRTMLEGSTPRIIPNFERIDSVLTTLLEAYQQTDFPYDLDSARVPQDPRHMPRNLNLDPEDRTEQEAIALASFWFADCYYMRGVNDSNQMTVNLADLHENHPEIFDFKIAATLEPKYVEGLLLDYHLAVQHKQTSEHWVENAKRMVARYDGNPFNIFENVATYDELVERVRNDHKGNGFKGFQKKMVSMLEYFLMATDLIPYRNHPLPVDFHVIRLSVSNELVTFENLPHSGQIPFEQTTDFLREVFYDFADHHNISQLDLCDVVWLFSRELCSRSPSNTMRKIGEYAGRGTELQKALTSVDAATLSQREQYAQSCGKCPIRLTCAHDVPAATYYTHGVVIAPNEKPHLEQVIVNHSLEIDEVSPTYNETIHAIDKRKPQRQAAKRKRIATLRALAHPALPGLAFGLSGNGPVFTTRELSEALSHIHPEDAENVASIIRLRE